MPFDASTDGSTIVGTSISARGSKAFIWDRENGMRSLSRVLRREYEAELTGWKLFEARGVSDDGLTITGRGINPDGVEEGWVVRLTPTADSLPLHTKSVPEPASAILPALILLISHRRRRRSPRTH